MYINNVFEKCKIIEKHEFSALYQTKHELILKTLKFVELTHKSLSLTRYDRVRDLNAILIIFLATFQDDRATEVSHISARDDERRVEDRTAEVMEVEDCAVDVYL